MAQVLTHCSVLIIIYSLDIYITVRGFKYKTRCERTESKQDYGIRMRIFISQIKITQFY